jgi:hypothetical protein
MTIIHPYSSSSPTHVIDDHNIGSDNPYNDHFVDTPLGGGSFEASHAVIDDHNIIGSDNPYNNHFVDTPLVGGGSFEVSLAIEKKPSLMKRMEKNFSIKNKTES